MQARSEQAAVGLFVIVAAGLLIFTVFALGGAFSSSSITYRAYFPFAGGIEPGATGALFRWSKSWPCGNAAH